MPGDGRAAPRALTAAIASPCAGGRRIGAGALCRKVMALLEEWILPVEVDKKLQRSIESVASRILPEGVEWSASFKDGKVSFTAQVPAHDLSDLTVELDEPLERLEDWDDWEEEIDEIAGDAYALKLECRQKQPESFEADEALPILSVSSKEGDNLAAWPAAFVLTARIARELGATTPDE